MAVFWAGVADDFGQFFGVTFGTLRANEIGAGRVQLGAALQAQVPVRVGIARLGGEVFAATGSCYQGEEHKQQLPCARFRGVKAVQRGFNGSNRGAAPRSSLIKDLHPYPGKGW